MHGSLVLAQVICTEGLYLVKKPCICVGFMHGSHMLQQEVFYMARFSVTKAYIKIYAWKPCTWSESLYLNRLCTRKPRNWCGTLELKRLCEHFFFLLALIFFPGNLVLGSMYANTVLGSLVLYKVLCAEALNMAKLYVWKPVTLMHRNLVLGQVIGTANLVAGQVLRMEALYVAFLYTRTWPGYMHGSHVIGPEAL